MANTEKGIYFPNDYEKVADILADLKQMAESIDIAIKNITPNQLFFLKQETFNVFNNDDEANLTEGIINSAGVINTEETDYYTTPYMSIVPNTNYYKGNNYQGAFYDKDKNFIIGNIFGLTEVTAPSDACYYRTSFLKTDVARFYVSTIARFTKYGFNPFYILDDNFTNLIKSLSILSTKVNANETDFFTTTDTNIYSDYNSIEGYALSSSDRIVENANFFVTDYLKLPQNSGYLYVSKSYQVLVYDSSMNIIASYSGNNTEKNFILTEGSAYIRACFSLTDKKNSLILLNETLEEYENKTKESLLFRTNNQLISIINQLSNNGTFQNNIKSIVQGSSLTQQNWCAIGDSWTEFNSTADNNYVKLITNYLNLNTTNLGIGGTGFKRQEENNKAYYQRIDQIPDNTQILTIMGSGNDLGGGYSLGSTSDSGTDTICGCINTTLDEIFEKFSGIKIGLISLAPWKNYPPNASNAFSNYANAMKTIAQNRGIPFLDLYHSSNLRPWDENFRTIYMPDGVHPNDEGTLLFVNRIKEFLAQL